MQSGDQTQKTQFRIVKFCDIIPPELAMRSDAMEGDFMDLVNSIQQNGLTNPITVKAKDGKFEVVAGHRRWLAMKQLEWELIPCMEYTGSDRGAEVVKIHENIIREKVKPTNEAQHYKKLLERYNIEPRELAKLLGKSKQFIEERLDILNYPVMLFECVEREEISLSVARELSRMKDLPGFENTVRYIVSAGGTQAQVKGWVDGWIQEAQFKGQSNDGSSPVISGQAFIEQEVICELSGKKYKLSDTKLLRVGWDVFNDLVEATRLAM